MSKTMKATVESRVLDRIRASGERGMTCLEVEVEMGLSHQSAAARCSTLKTMGAVVDSGERRSPRKGRPYAVLVCPEFANGRTAVQRFRRAGESVPVPSRVVMDKALADLRSICAGQPVSTELMEVVGWLMDFVNGKKG